MSSKELLHVLDSLGRPNILVLGDLILDRYTWGNAERISQEAPVVVLKADRREARPGGAANVANMLAALDAEVTCAGVVGDDGAGLELRQLLVESGTSSELILKDIHRPTSVKERFMGRAASRHPSQILRVDHENCDRLCEPLETELITKLVAQIPRHDALLISDYGKGVCTPSVLQAAISTATRAGILVMVDPSRDCPLVQYRGATLIKPNRAEAEIATRTRITKPTDALEAGKRLCQEVSAQMALITLDRDGMVLARREGAGEVFSTHARTVYDITGAGDMVMAMVGLCLAASVPAGEAVRLGNVAAGLEVERAGVVTIRRDEVRSVLLAGQGGPSPKIVRREQAAALAEEHRRRGQKVVLTNGCFDLLHVGHVTYLAEAAHMGDVLVVGVNSDSSVRNLKGPGRPVIAENDRAAMLAALSCVDYVVIFDEETPHVLLEAIRPEVLVKGGTYSPDEVVGHEIVKAYGGTVTVTGVLEGISTTNILASLARGEAATARATDPNPQGKAEFGPRLRRAG